MAESHLTRPCILYNPTASYCFFILDLKLSIHTAQAKDRSHLPVIMSTASSPPRSILTSPITTATTTTTTSSAHHVVHSQQHHQPHPQQTIHATLPSAETQRDIASARNAVVASLGNMVDAELQSRATTLHENAAALDRQEKGVLAATTGLRREREKLAKEAGAAAKKLKELGNVQNWAEVLEGKFMVLEETVRLANGGREYKEGDDRGSSRSGSYCSCSCSDCGDDDDNDHLDGAMHLDRGDAEDGGFKDGVNGHGDVAPKEQLVADIMEVQDGRPDVQETWSNSSRSFNEPELSTGTRTAKGSDTASMSTTS